MVFSCCLRNYSRFFKREPFNMSSPTSSQSPCSYSASSQRYRNAVQTSIGGMIICFFFNSVTLGTKVIRSKRTEQIRTCLFLLLPVRHRRRRRRHHHHHQGRSVYLFWSYYNKNSLQQITMNFSFINPWTRITYNNVSIRWLENNHSNNIVTI
jgi:hypothetical protein